MLPLDGRIEPIWLSMRAIVESSRTDVPTATALTACAAIYSPLNLYLVASWSPFPTTNLAPNTLHAFDTLTGAYVGRWIIGPGICIETMGILKDANGELSLCVVGTQVSAINNGFGGYVWRLSNAQENLWTDAGQLPTISATTQRMGFDADVARYADRATAITGSASPVALSILTPYTLEQSFMTDVVMSEDGLSALMSEDGTVAIAGESLAQLTATPNSPTLDGTYRVTWGTDIEGRGFNATMTPTTAAAQWRLHQFQLTTIASLAPPEEA